MFPLVGACVFRATRQSIGPNLQRAHVRGMVRYDEFLEFEKWQHLPRKLQFEKSEGALQDGKGKAAAKYPFKYTIEKGKKYSWCSCGFSHTQPFCDGSHKQKYVISGLKPLKFIAEETKEVWFCNCKQTGNKPYCDDTCKTPEVQEVRVN
ncbi:putative CDGSH iron-sulfur domain-containing protein 3, mitochondrial [Hypsibius exemplaris]|uniref:CDGSH iron-sulfur domain-containing protein 3, mitochondrial n=1 Tax=Hypsibius exemplaris TaxID=2072580 RepID=A0A1W0WNW2_HYPEX|nr:putative CDGSH iron-sulfur domain-containing protein 3, mitochondrial [Hypsibius exemplaris]